jgi:IS66 Orf2 like protein
MAAAGRPHGFRVTPQQRGYRDASIKRLEAGSFEMPRTAEPDGIELRPAQLAMILSGIDLRSARQRKRFQRAG